eukprot:TRINITY_DN6852_c0_g2_i1.p2 TRINITY_DN6852_c0_g2~~TRINITY_DN6852_c0_g2_i1.p2  ORF type:complete len:487 (+),score=161.38 TRINITY_DN6852_c0_g2_i1:106-1461(+)
MQRGRGAARALAGVRRYCTHPYVYSDRNMRATYGKAPPALDLAPSGPEQSATPTGVRVRTQDNGEATALVAFYVDAGCIYESAADAGTAHYLSEMLYKSNLVSSDYHQFKRFQHSAANYWTGQLQKRWLTAKVECRRDLVPEMVAAMCEAMFIPRFAAHELANVRELVENKAATRDHNAVEYARAAACDTAFQGSPYGNSALCPSYNVDTIQSSDIVNWWSRTFLPERIQLVGVNVSQQELVDAFNGAEWSACSPGGPSHSGVLALPAPDASGSYVGGELRQFVRATDKFASQRFYNDVVIAYGRKGLGRQDTKECAAMLVCAAAAEGDPLYEHFDDTGLVGGVVRVRPGEADGAVRALAAAVNGTGSLSGDRLAMAKKRAAAGLLAAVDTREGLADFLVLHGGRPPAELLAAVGAVSAADLKRAADCMQAAPPTMVAYGDLSSTPSLATL